MLTIIISIIILISLYFLRFFKKVKRIKWKVAYEVGRMGSIALYTIVMNKKFQNEMTYVTYLHYLFDHADKQLRSWKSFRNEGLIILKEILADALKHADFDSLRTL